jgi:hypothetical protein
MVPNVAYIGGFGSGKTFSLCIKAFMISARHGHLPLMVVAPTYRMLRNTVIPTFEDIIEKFGVASLCKWRAQDMVYTMPWGGDVIFASADDPTRLRGPNLVAALVDEATLIRKFGQVFVSLTSRLRHPEAMCLNGKRYFTAKEMGLSEEEEIEQGFIPLYQFAICGTPEGHLDEIYDIFYRAPEDPEKVDFWRRSFHVVNATTMDNVALSSSYLDNLMSNIPEALRPALIGGQYVDLSKGRAYYAFDEFTNLTDSKYDPDLPIRLAWDFNLDPLICLVCQIHGGNTLVVIDELGLKQSNTPNMCRVLIEKYGPRGLDHRGPIFIYGDVFGKTTTAQWSDYETIRDYLETAFRGENISLKVPSKNPAHKHRVQSVNAKLKNSRGETTLLIDKKCWRLIRDLRFQRMEEAQKDKRQEMDGETIGHASDCLDYIVHYEWPYKRPSIGSAVHANEMTEWYSKAKAKARNRGQRA